MSPIEILRVAVESYAPYLQASGELFDPVVGTPTQYSTPYHALCNALLAEQVPARRELYLERARRGLSAAIDHVADPSIPAFIGGVGRERGTMWGGNHRDFFWPAILKTFLIIRKFDAKAGAAIAKRLAAIDIEAAFAMRPPSNWAAVWLSGEWLRFREGLSPFSRDRLDDWIGGFFHGHVLLEQGFYQEPGHPNSYDLFTRYHFADLLMNGYDGRWRESLEKLMETGLRQSLAMQLSDGSLASAHRSTGQTWTLGIQCAYFTHAFNFFKSRDAKLSELAGVAACALRSFARYQRKDGPFSPVENCLPMNWRIGYEGYTADGHYGNLAMAFLGVAIQNGLGGIPEPATFDRPDSAQIQGDPTCRAVAHCGPYSLHVNAFPETKYDGFGLVDLTFGVGRYLQFASTVKFLGGGEKFHLGLAMREGPGRSEIFPIAQKHFTLIRSIERGKSPASLRFEAREPGVSYTYRFEANLDQQGAHVIESTPGNSGHKTLLIPYVRDPGSGATTNVATSPGEIRLTLGGEVVAIRPRGEIENIVHLPFGYESRRGFCGLVRVDLREPAESLAWDATVAR